MALFYKCIQKPFISKHSKLCQAHVNKQKDQRNLSLAELIWKGMVGNFSIGNKKCESLFVSSQFSIHTTARIPSVIGG